MLTGLTKLGIPAENIQSLEEPTRAQVHAKIDEIKNIFTQNVENDQRSFLLCYYAGHGCSGFGPH